MIKHVPWLEKARQEQQRQAIDRVLSVIPPEGIHTSAIDEALGHKKAATKILKPLLEAGRVIAADERYGTSLRVRRRYFLAEADRDAWMVPYAVGLEAKLQARSQRNLEIKLAKARSVYAEQRIANAQAKAMKPPAPPKQLSQKAVRIADNLAVGKHMAEQKAAFRTSNQSGYTVTAADEAKITRIPTPPNLGNRAYVDPAAMPSLFRAIPLGAMAVPV